ncbi:MAG: EI24 domain-containing protein [bacterium]|nr:EI24 domain-containing protein [bacterium]
MLIPFTALLQGLRLCLRDHKVRRLALWPFLIGSLCYVICLAGSYHFHSHVLAFLLPDWSGFFASVAWVVCWFFAFVIVMLGSALLSLLMVMIFAGLFQSMIAEEILSRADMLPASDSGIVPLAQDLFRTAWQELVKFLIFLPVWIVLLIFGFLPFFTVPAFVMAAWLLGYQFLDIPLDAVRWPLGRRLGFALRRPLLTIGFGAILVVFWPFVGFILPPVASAAATIILVQASNKG